MFANALNQLSRFLKRPPTPLEPVEVQKSFFGCDSWDETRHLLQRHPAELLGDEAQRFFVVLRSFVLETGRTHLIPIIDERRHALALCRLEGNLSPLDDFPEYTRRQVLDAVCTHGDIREFPSELVLESLFALIDSGQQVDRWDALHRLLPEGTKQAEDAASVRLALLRLQFQRADFLHHKLGNRREAGECYRAALETAIEVGYAHGITHAAHGLAMVCFGDREPDTGLGLLDQSLSMAHECNSIPAKIRAQRVLGRRLKDARRIAESESHLTSSLHLALAAAEFDDAEVAALSLRVLGMEENRPDLVTQANDAVAEIERGRKENADHDA